MNYYKKTTGGEISDKEFLISIIKYGKCPCRCLDSCQFIKICHIRIFSLLTTKKSKDSITDIFNDRKREAIKVYLERYGEDSFFEEIL